MRPYDWIRRTPWKVVATFLTITLLGLLGIARSEDLADDGKYYVQRQISYSLLAMATAVLVSLPNYRIICRWAYAVFGAALMLLVLAYFFPAINGTHRWIRIGPIGLQPSEFAKIAFVLAISRYLMHRENYRRLQGLIVPLGVTMVPVLLILREPDLGTALVFLPVLFLMLFAAGARRGDLALVAIAGMMTLPVLWTQMSREQRSRVTALFEQPAADERPSDDAYHLHQAKRMAAMGGLWGSAVVGQPTDDLAAYHLPEARSDFIVCVLRERFGLIGFAGVLVLFTHLAWRGLAIATATREPFGRLVAVGLVSLISVQVLINTAMTVGLLPVTGLPLPLVSQGGSGLLANGIALGLLINIAQRPGYDVTKEPFRYRIRSGRTARTVSQR